MEAVRNGGKERKRGMEEGKGPKEREGRAGWQKTPKLPCSLTRQHTGLRHLSHFYFFRGVAGALGDVHLQDMLRTYYGPRVCLGQWFSKFRVQKESPEGPNNYWFLQLDSWPCATPEKIWQLLREPDLAGLGRVPGLCIPNKTRGRIVWKAALGILPGSGLLQLSLFIGCPIATSTRWYTTYLHVAWAM